MEYVSMVLEHLREGYAEINGLQGLIVALIAAVYVSEWKSFPSVLAAAVVGHVAIDVLAPVFANNDPLRLPPIFDGWWWRYVLLLTAGYAVVIGLLAALKKVVLRR